MQPRKSITAHVICVPVQEGRQAMATAEADAWLSAQIAGGACNLADKPLSTYSHLRNPGWSHENQNFSFYDDSSFPSPTYRTSNTTTGTARKRAGWLSIRQAQAVHQGLGHFVPLWSTPSMKRIALFLLTNIAVVAVLGIVASLLGVNLSDGQRPEPGRLAGLCLHHGLWRRHHLAADLQAHGQVDIGRAGHQRTTQCR